MSYPKIEPADNIKTFEIYFEKSTTSKIKFSIITTKN